MQVRLWILLLAAALCGCGPSSTEVKHARSATYSCPYDQVFDAVVAEVKDRAPPLGVVDKGAGGVASEYRWHTRDGARRQAGAATVADDDVQFRVTVLVQKRDAGWGLLAEPQILSTFGGNPGGRELTRKDGDWPEWADTKTDAIVHAVYERLKSCAAP